MAQTSRTGTGGRPVEMANSPGPAAVPGRIGLQRSISVFELDAHPSRPDSESPEQVLRRALEVLKEADRSEPALSTKASVSTLADGPTWQLLQACLSLTQLAEKAPTQLYLQAKHVLDAIWPAVRSPVAEVRVAAARAVRGCLSVVGQRESHLHVRWYQSCVEGVTAGLGEKRDESAHGSLLVLSELIDVSGCLVTGFEAGAQAFEAYKDSRSRLVRASLIALLPRLTAAVPPGMATRWPQQAVAHLLASLSAGPELRAAAFVALGQMAAAVGPGPRFAEHVAAVVQACHEALQATPPSKRDARATSKGAPCTAEALECLGALARARAPRLEAHLADHGLLGSLFTPGLSPVLAATLTALAEHIPALLPQLQRRLLEVVCHILTGVSYDEWSATRAERDAAPREGSQHTPRGSRAEKPSYREGEGSFTKKGSGGKFHEEGEGTAQAILALQTLGSFDMRGCDLLHFVRDSVAGYMSDEAPDVREAAAVTCCRLLAARDAGLGAGEAGGPLQERRGRCSSGTSTGSSAQQCYEDELQEGLQEGVEREEERRRERRAQRRQQLADEVLEQVLVVGVADDEPEVRYAVLSAFTPEFDPQLAQGASLELLLLGLNDETAQAREAAIRVLGRLGLLNPSHVMPALRTHLIDLLTEIEHSSSEQRRDDAAHLLGKLICASPTLIRPYAATMLKVLEPHLAASACALATIGELAVVAGTAVRPSMPTLLPQLLPLLQDRGSAYKRCTTLHALSQLLRSPGCLGEAWPEGTPSPSEMLLSTLLAMLGSEQDAATRLELLRALGALGAPDPSTREMRQLQFARQRGSTPSASAVGAGGDAAHEGGDALAPEEAPIGPAHPDFYPSIALRALTGILRDPSLLVQHGLVIQAMMSILRSLGSNSLGSKCMPHLPVVMPLLLQTSQSPEPALREVAVEQLGHLVSIMGLHVRSYLPSLLALARDHLKVVSSVQTHCISLLEHLCKALADEFGQHLPPLMPRLLAILHSDRTERRLPTQRVLHALETFNQNIHNQLHLVVPAVMRLCEQEDTPPPVRLRGVRLFGRLCARLDFREHASRIALGMTRILSTASVYEYEPLMDTLCALVRGLGSDFAVFVPTVAADIERLDISHPAFEALIAPYRKGGAAAAPTGAAVAPPSREAALLMLENRDPLGAPPSPGLMPSPSLALAAANAYDGTSESPLNQKRLQSAWTTTERSTRADWHAWMRRLSVEMLRESPSPALRACTPLAQVCPPLARELFNAAFLSCWSELTTEGYQESFVASLETALDAENMSLEVLQPLLNLAEFMELADRPLPIDIRKLGELAEKCHAYAKALHYREVEFHSYPAETIEALISINNHLQQPEAAQGILAFARQHYHIELKESWYEKLQRWSDARAAYERKQQEDPENLAWKVGTMRCLHALGDWEPLCQLARDTWGSAQLDDERGDELSMQNRAEVARLAAAGAWNLRLWGEMEHYCASMPADTVETSFFRAVLAVHGDEFSAARLHIDEARRQLDSEFTALVGESYNRAYRIMIEVLQMSELEEIILHKERPVAMPLAHLCRMWQERVNAAQCDAEVWQDILSVRDLAAPPTKETRTWLKFCRLCLRSGRSTQSRKILVQLIGYEPTRGQPFPPALSPPVALAYVKQLWVEGARDEALERVRAFVADPRMTQDPKLAAKAFIKCGQWQQEYYTSGRAGAALAAPSGAPPAVGRGGSGGDWRDGPGTEPLDEAHTAAVLESLRRASELDPKSYKAWHTWAMVNFEAVGSPTGDGSRYVVPAIAGFFRSIALGRERALQDTLRLLTMWFKYGATPAVDEAVQRGFLAIPIDTWLLVTPQIIAHIHSSTTLVRRSVHTLLCRVAKAHPQGLVYPLTVASKSQSMPRQRAAQRVLAEMRKQCDRLVEQAALVSVELIRTSILWHEMWHTALEDASRMYFGAQDVDGMLETLLPLHQMLQRGPETMRESSFQQAFGAELQRAHELCQQYKLTLARTDLHAAWDIYYAVFRRISKQIAKFTVLELQHVSPKLQEARDLELAVPGTYQAGCPVVRIREFARSMTVIASKQRPRKLTVNGSDGSRHAFLLKGHEDLRQDERVMQLFGLVNTLLSTDRDTSTKDLAIQRYSVVPLSPNSGLISWVAQCDTLHALIKDFRDTRKILLNIEHRLMLQMAPDYDGLPVLNKLEVFVHTLDNSGGHDLARVLWLRSRNAEHWLQRRTTYTRSLAVMSMVGYILGLGDRHPSNLMLDRLTGKILHIDFGDCFEVAVHRDKFPEKIPFRLTRMLVNAMEVSGIEGNFRSTCEAVMSMLRNNKDSVLAMLEAFVHDPLINWRLLARPSPSASSTGGRSRAASHVETRSRGASNVSSSAADARGRARATSMGAVDPATARAGLPEDVVRLLAELDADPERGRDLGPSPEAEGGREVWNHPAAVIGTPRSEDGVRDGGGKSAIAASRRSMRERIEPLQQQDEQVLNERALSVLRRVKTKLAGTDFPDQRLEVEAQVDLLVREAQSDLNLCQLYVGWCPFW